MSITVTFFTEQHPMNHTDGGGIDWLFKVGVAGELDVYQQLDGSDDPAPITLASHVYAPGTWKTVVFS